MPKRHLTSQEKLVLLDRFRKSGLSAARFCRENNLVLSTFNLWKQSHARNQNQKSLFVPAVLKEQLGVPSKTRLNVARLLIPGSLVLEFSEDCDPVWLSQVLGGLR